MCAKQRLGTTHSAIIARNWLKRTAHRHQLAKELKKQSNKYNILLTSWFSSILVTEIGRFYRATITQTGVRQKADHNKGFMDVKAAGVPPVITAISDICSDIACSRQAFARSQNRNENMTKREELFILWLQAKEMTKVTVPPFAFPWTPNSLSKY